MIVSIFTFKCEKDITMMREQIHLTFIWKKIRHYYSYIDFSPE